MKFEYYIFLDYSESLIGYTIISQVKINKILPLISKFKHYKDIKNKKQYLKAIQRSISNSHLMSMLDKVKIKHMRYNLELILEIIDFIQLHQNSIIFASIDDHQFISFSRLIKNMYQHAKIQKESELKKDSIEYRLSLIIDTILNIERRKSK